MIYLKRYDEANNIDIEASNTELKNLTDEQLSAYAEITLVNPNSINFKKGDINEVEEYEELEEPYEEDNIEHDYEDNSDSIYYEDDIKHYENAIYLPADILSFDYASVQERLPIIPIEDNFFEINEEDENIGELEYDDIDELEQDDIGELEHDDIMSEETLELIGEYMNKFKIIEHGIEIDDVEKTDVITALNDTIEAENEYLLNVIGYVSQINYEYDCRAQDMDPFTIEKQFEDVDGSNKNPDIQDQSDDGDR